MTSTRTLSLLGVALLSVTMLAGCASSEPVSGEASAVEQSRAANNTDELYSDPTTFFTTLPNGAKVLCVGINDHNAGYGAGTNFDCDWTNAQGLNVPAAKR